MLPQKSMYHASLTHSTKSQIEDLFWRKTDLRCLVATVAFGMVQYLSKHIRTCTFINVELVEVEVLGMTLMEGVAVVEG